MILKPWAEVPTPRHLLDDNDELEGSEAEALLSAKPWTKVEVASDNLNAEQLVFIAPRLSLYGEYLTKIAGGKSEKIGTVTSGVSRDPLGPPSTKSSSVPPIEIYEFNEEDPSTSNSTAKLSEKLHEADVYLIPQTTTAVIILPPLSPSHCYEYASQVLSTFKPLKAVILAPGNMVSTSSNIYKLTTSNIPSSYLTQIPSLEPPFMISGAPAAILTRLEFLQIPSIAIVVKAEGPQGYEIIDHNSTNRDISSALELTFELPPNSVNVPSHTNVDQGLYI